MSKILFKISHFPQVSETFVTAQIVTAIKAGFEVQVLVKEVLDSKENGQQEILERYKIFDKLIIENLEIPSNGSLRLIKAFWILILNFLHLKSLLKYLNERKYESSVIYEFHFYKQFRKYDIIHIQFGTNHQPFEKLKKTKVLQGKLIVSFHGHDAFFPIYGFIKEGYYRTLFSVADLIIVNTEYLAVQIISIGCPKDKIKIIPVGVDTSFFRPRENNNPRIDNRVQIVTIGRLDKVKGQKYTIECLKELHLKGINANLIIIGEGEERNNLEKLIEYYKLQNSVCLLGKKNYMQIRQLLQESDIYILCSVPVENKRRETQGLATLEAQACGIPVVAFNSGGVKFTIRHSKSGFLVQEYDIKDMVQKLELLIRDENLRRTMGDSAVHFVYTNFSQEMIDKVWNNLYKELLN